MKRLFKNLDLNNGSILIVVLLTFVILSILTMSIIYINSANTRETVSQIESMQAYYLAYSGIEIGYSALMMDNGQLFNEFKSGHIGNIEDRINYPNNNEGKIDIRIKSSSDKKTITIISIGTHVESGKTKELKMSFPIDSPSLKKWE